MNERSLYSRAWDRTLSLPKKAARKTHLAAPKTLPPNIDAPDKEDPQDSHHQQQQPHKKLKSRAGLTRTVSGVVKRRKHIVLMGLDSSGKTTILMRLKYGLHISTVPTIGFNHEKLWGGGFRWSAWDVGGGEKFRPLWVMYARATDGIVFVVDASSTADVVEEARVELSRVIKASKLSAYSSNVSPPPVLVLANFQDRPYARTPEEMAVVLGLSEHWASGVMWAVAPTCGLTGEGLDEALQTLRALIDSTRSEKKKVERGLPKAQPRWRW